MAETKYFARAVPIKGGGFHSEYGAPGLEPAFVLGIRNARVVSSTQDDAELVAARILIDVLNSRATSLNDDNKPEKWLRMTAQEFSVSLADLNMSPTFFAFIFGTSQRRVLSWIEGTQEVPHAVRLILEACKADLDNLDLFEQVTERVASERRPRITKEQANG